MATLIEATLDPVERRALDRLVELLEAEYGPKPARGLALRVSGPRRTHRGIWRLFHQTFVESERLDPELHRAASSALEKRIAADYHGAHFGSTEASRCHHDAERFLEAVEAMLDGEAGACPTVVGTNARAVTATGGNASSIR